MLLEGARSKELGGSRRILEQGSTSASFAQVSFRNASTCGSTCPHLPCL
uniref:Uncharacterized protein n=1 Tax=Anguilla anguilla TaxID=7936 RepID=A0A0E9XM18_ANGAN